MKDENKHKIASAIYNGLLAIKRELRIMRKPILIGLGIAVFFFIFVGFADHADTENLFAALAIIGFFIPILYAYLKRLKNWVLKWK